MKRKAVKENRQMKLGLFKTQAKFKSHTQAQH